MFELSPSPALAPSLAPVPVAPVTLSGEFAAALADLTVPAAQSAIRLGKTLPLFADRVTLVVPSVTVSPDRQEVANVGKILPDTAVPLPQVEDTDPSLAWLTADRGLSSSSSTAPVPVGSLGAASTVQAAVGERTPPIDKPESKHTIAAEEAAIDEAVPLSLAPVPLNRLVQKPVNDRDGVGKKSKVLDADQPGIPDGPGLNLVFQQALPILDPHPVPSVRATSGRTRQAVASAAALDPSGALPEPADAKTVGNPVAQRLDPAPLRETLSVTGSITPTVAADSAQRDPTILTGLPLAPSVALQSLVDTLPQTSRTPIFSTPASPINVGAVGPQRLAGDQLVLPPTLGRGSSLPVPSVSGALGKAVAIAGTDVPEPIAPRAIIASSGPARVATGGGAGRQVSGLAATPVPAVAPVPLASAPIRVSLSDLIGVPQLAGQAFAAQIAAAVDRPLRALRDDKGAAAPPAQAISASLQPVTASDPVASPAPIDTRREDWTRTLIDRIDAVQDVSNARDTRIRLIPDALGKIDVALHRQGDTLHVQFTAEVAATRVLLADAQPRLAELADARGLRLGQAAVDGGGQNPGQQSSRQPTPSSPVSNRITSASIEGEGDQSDDRIA